MAAAPVPNDQRLELPFNSTPKVAGRERRELERAITSWEQEAILLGRISPGNVEMLIERMREKLTSFGIGDRVQSDCATALRRYAEFRSSKRT
jgi:hypothetical protein